MVISNMKWLEKINSPLVRDYLTMVENTESPRLFHIWALISTMSASLARKAWFELGELTIYPNQYVLLIGGPAVKKSVTIGFMQNIIRMGTNGIRFGVDDTSGQRQGLITNIMGETRKKNKEEETLNTIMSSDMFIDLADITKSHIKTPKQEVPDLLTTSFDSTHSSHSIYMCTSGEITSFFGNNNAELMTCLTSLYDNPKDYNYQLKNESIHVIEPNLNILGASTSDSLAANLPKNCLESGFISRVMLVYGERPYKSVPRPPRFDMNMKIRISNAIDKGWNELFGKFSETDEAANAIDELYGYTVPHTDYRLRTYQGRRHAHLLKLCMAFAACRGELCIRAEDVADAHLLLTETERGMSDALGQYGMTDIAIKQEKLLDYLRTSGGFMTRQQLHASLHKELTNTDFSKALYELTTVGKILRYKRRSPHSPITDECYIYAYDRDIIRRKLTEVIDQGHTLMEDIDG